jgi:hypothetical protein
MLLEDEHRIYAELLQLHPSRRETSSSVISRLQPCERRTAQQSPKGSSERMWGGSPHQSSSTQVHCIRTRNHRHIGEACWPPCSSICPNRTFREQVPVQAPSSTNCGIVVQQIMTELTEHVSKEDKIMVVTKMVLNETKCLLDFIGHSKP